MIQSRTRLSKIYFAHVSRKWSPQKRKDLRTEATTTDRPNARDESPVAACASRRKKNPTQQTNPVQTAEEDDATEEPVSDDNSSCTDSITAHAARAPKTNTKQATQKRGSISQPQPLARDDCKDCDCEVQGPATRRETRVHRTPSGIDEVNITNLRELLFG